MANLERSGVIPKGLELRPGLLAWGAREGGKGMLFSWRGKGKEENTDGPREEVQHSTPEGLYSRFVDAAKESRGRRITRKKKGGGKGSVALYWGTTRSMVGTVIRYLVGEGWPYFGKARLVNWPGTRPSVSINEKKSGNVWRCKSAGKEECSFTEPRNIPATKKKGGVKKGGATE